MKSILILAVFLVLLGSCDKSVSDECDELKTALIINDEVQAESSINKLISRLGSITYTETNLALLTGYIASNCSVEASMDCFDCVKTLPSATEIRITIGGVTKTIDLSYDSSDLIVFRGMH